MSNDNSQKNSQKKCALVTGASSGIGYELANVLAQNNYNLILCAQNRDNLVEAADKLRNLNANVQIDIVDTDLTKRTGVQKLYDTAKTIGPVDVLCANAGAGVYGNFSTETSLDDEFNIIDLNTKSVVQLTKLISNDMVKRGSGKILITASVVSFVPDAYQTVYAATKAFDYIFAQGLRESLRDKGVSVTALMPGATDTNFFRRAGAMESKIVQEGGMADPADVAKTAFKALMDGDDHVVHGFKNKMMVQFAELAPSPLVARMNAQMMKPAEKKAS